MGFRNPRALGYSVPSAARALLRARGFINPVVTEVAASNLFRMLQRSSYGVSKALSLN